MLGAPPNVAALTPKLDVIPGAPVTVEFPAKLPNVGATAPVIFAVTAPVTFVSTLPEIATAKLCP